MTTHFHSDKCYAVGPGETEVLICTIPVVDNGNLFVFCDYVGVVADVPRGCVRGAGHNGPHLFPDEDYDPTNGPVMIRTAQRIP